MKKFLILTIVTLMGAQCFSQKLILHYDFKKAENGLVTDRTKSHYNGSLMGSAKIESAQDGNCADLGYGNGYIDMGSNIGKKLQSIDEFTVAVKYKVDEKASLQGNGYFLWAFSTLEQNTQHEGRYHAYKLNVQRGENSIGGWANETILEIGKQSEKGKWLHVVYTQKGSVGTLYLNGQQVDANNDMFTLDRTFPDEAPAFNWIGRAPFKGDAFLAGTKIADVRVYDGALTAKQVKKLSKKQLK
jgi:hypothetical protein